MGEVYRARDSRLGRYVAIKVATGRFSDHFEREVQAIAVLNHPHIYQIYDVRPNYLGSSQLFTLATGSIPDLEYSRNGPSWPTGLEVANAGKTAN